MRFFKLWRFLFKTAEDYPT